MAYKPKVGLQNCTQNDVAKTGHLRSRYDRYDPIVVLSRRSWLKAILALPFGLPLLETRLPAQVFQRTAAYLADAQDKFHRAFDVYTDADAAGNHFAYRGRMSSDGDGDGDAVPAMNEAWTENPHSGLTCIRAALHARTGRDNWGGWYIMNGVLRGDEVVPSENWGTERDAGMDLTGATELTFWARGERGGERVEFFCLGVGRNAETGRAIEPRPDSSAKASTGLVRLTNQWKQYSMPLTGRDLRYVLGGFGWVATAATNVNSDIAFYLDDIRYDKPRLSEPRFLLSYETIRSTEPFDFVLRNVAFTYDNAVALVAFLAAGDLDRAGLIASALIYAQEHDRFFNDGRLRNAYQAGDLILPPGWTPHGRVDTVRMPGWYQADRETWFEDKFAASTHTGNIAWAALALLAYFERTGDATALQSAVKLGEWVEANCRDDRGSGGYTGGYEGWEPNPAKLTYKATEHNLDLLAAFRRLYLATKESRWIERAEHAYRFLNSMWDAQEGKFWTGTGLDGVSTNTDVIPLDVQAWGVLCLADRDRDVIRALSYAENHLSSGDGFDFNQDLDGIWYEGTAQMADAYKNVRQFEAAERLLRTLHQEQAPSGGLWAANHDGLTTGFDLPDGQPWLYYRRLHVGASSWLALAEAGFNPFSPASSTRAVNAASLDLVVAAPESIISIFGDDLAATVEIAASGPLPFGLGGAEVVVISRTGAEHRMPLLYASPRQINCVVPEGVSAGSVRVEVRRQSSTVAACLLEIAEVAPGLFYVPASGQPIAAAVAQVIHPDGSVSLSQTVACSVTSPACTAAAIELNGPNQQAVLSLYGTGIRGTQSPAKVSIGGIEVDVYYAGSQGQFDGLDQVNASLPALLAGRGIVPVRLECDGVIANTVYVKFL